MSSVLICSWMVSLCEIFPTDAGQLSDRLKFLAGQNKILRDRRLVCYQIIISFCQKSQDICQTNWNFLQDRMKIWQFCQTVLQFSQRLNGKSDWAKNWWKALGPHGDSELLKLFCHNIYDGGHSSHLEALQLLAHLEHCSSQLMPWSVDHDQSIIVCTSVVFCIFNISIRIVSMMDTTAAILKVFSFYLLPNDRLDGAETLWKALGQLGDLELLKWFRSNIQDGHHGSHLENLQITSAPNGKTDWAQTWWAA